MPRDGERTSKHSKRARLSSCTRRAVVTGCSRGLGLACAQRLANEGYEIAVVCRRMADAKAVLKKLTPGSVPIQLDFAKGQSAVHAAAEQIAAWAGNEGLALLINNAGNSWGYWDDEAWKDSCAVNFTGPLLLTKALFPTFADGSLITMVGSGLGDLKWVSQKYQRLLANAQTVADLEKITTRSLTSLESSWVGPYGLSKALLHRATEILAADPAWSGRHIALNAVCPGWVSTDMGGQDAPISVEEGSEHILERALSIGPRNSGDFKCFCYRNFDEHHQKSWEGDWTGESWEGDWDDASWTN